MLTVRISTCICLTLLTLPACKKASSRDVETTTPSPVESAEQAPAQANANDEPGPEATEPPHVVTAEMIDAYLRYQKMMNEAAARGFDDLREFDRKNKADEYSGALGRARAAKDLISMGKLRDEAEAAARSKTGLTVRDTEQLAAIINSVIAIRGLSKQSPYDAMIKNMEEVKKLLPAEEQAAANDSIAEMKRVRSDLENLTEPRERFGQDNVARVLAREVELTKNHQDFMALLARP